MILDLSHLTVLRYLRFVVKTLSCIEIAPKTSLFLTTDYTICDKSSDPSPMLSFITFPFSSTSFTFSSFFKSDRLSAVIKPLSTSIVVKVRFTDFRSSDVMTVPSIIFRLLSGLNALYALMTSIIFG